MACERFMGAIEDEEPPLKRLKVSSPGLRRGLEEEAPSLSVGSVSILMAKSLSLEEGETVGSKGLIRRVEFVRIITQALYSLGYQKAGALLEEESGILLQSSNVALFRKQILDGRWDESVLTLRGIDQVEVEGNTLKAASFLILQQKFFELLDKGNIPEAMKTLRLEISPLQLNTKRVHELASCIVFPSRCEELGYSKQGNPKSSQRMKVLQEIQQLLPPSIMIPFSIY